MVQRVLKLGFGDLVYLSTCNRVEFYTTADDYFQCTRAQWMTLLKEFGLSEEAYYQGYHFEGKSALRHLLRVGASLESLVIGETQILGQLKDALKWNRENGLPVNRALERDFQLCFQTAKRIRTETAIGEKPVSVATLGLHHLQRLETQYPLTRAVVVGRSPISQLTVQWLSENRPQIPLVWVNRSVGALEAIPASSKAECIALSEFLESPGDFSHLFTATASPTPLFGEGFFRKLPGSQRLLFDYAQPADVEVSPECARAGRLLHMEDLVKEAQENARERKLAVSTAEAIISEALRAYCREQKEAPLLREFSAVEPQVLEELGRALLLIEQEFPSEFQPQVKRWAERLVKKSWHQSREHLREVLQKLTGPDQQVPLV